MKLEFLLCGSPTEGFFSQMAFFRLCLDALGGDEAAARLVCVFGDHEVAEIPKAWQPFFERIEVHWAHEPGADNPGHAKQHNMRFELLDPDADVSFICDADVAVLRPVTPLAAQLKQANALGGVIAHLHFPWEGRAPQPDIDWPEIAHAVLGRDISRPFSYTLLDPGAPTDAPFYINLGMFAGPPAQLKAFNDRDKELRPKVSPLLGEWWAPQVSLALTCFDLGLPVDALPMRYNFPNDVRADRLQANELAQVVFLHYLREKPFRRDHIFSDIRAFAEFLEDDLEGSNAVFQRHVHEITKGVYPFERPGTGMGSRIKRRTARYQFWRKQ